LQKKAYSQVQPRQAECLRYDFQRGAHVAQTSRLQFRASQKCFFANPILLARRLRYFHCGGLMKEVGFTKVETGDRKFMMLGFARGQTL